MTTRVRTAAIVSAKTSTPRAKKARPTKAASVGRLLTRAKGATLAEIAKATDWQPHSCRAFLTGLRKQGRVLVKEQRGDGVLAYRIAVTDAEVPAS